MVIISTSKSYEIMFYVFGTDDNQQITNSTYMNFPIPKEQEKAPIQTQNTKKLPENPLAVNSKIQQKIPKQQYKVLIPYNDEELYSAKVITTG